MCTYSDNGGRERNWNIVTRHRGDGGILASLRRWHDRLGPGCGDEDHADQDHHRAGELHRIIRGRYPFPSTARIFYPRKARASEEASALQSKLLRIYFA